MSIYSVPKEDLKTIFDPSFTTRSSVVQARLGLSISYQIVQEHDGNIIVESQPGKGSVLTMIIPMKFNDGTSRRSRSVSGG